MHDADDGPAHHDPELVALADRLAAGARRSGRRPYLVGVVGSVASGKSTTARHLAELVAAGELDAAVITTDSFLLPNERLEPLGGATVKGYPPSYDWPALDELLASLAAGATTVTTPVYSHEIFDIVPGAVERIEAPDVLIVEGLNLLQAPPTAPVDLRPHLQVGLYLHAPAEVLEDWFVARFLDLCRDAAPDSFYAAFAAMDDHERSAFARQVWIGINAPNLREHIEPTRARADLVVHLAPDHSIARLEEQARGLDLR